jgi:hypothetical protein
MQGILSGLIRGSPLIGIGGIEDIRFDLVTRELNTLIPVASDFYDVATQFKGLGFGIRDHGVIMTICSLVPGPDLADLLATIGQGLIQVDNQYRGVFR